MGVLNKERAVNFELLRIVSIFMVIILHFVNNSQLNDVINMYSTNGYVYSFVQGVCYTADNLFVLLSGYFLVKSKFKIRKVVDLWLQVFFYSVVFYFVLMSLGLVEFSLKTLYYTLTPVYSKAYWFFSCYIVLYLVSPLINIVIKNISKKVHLISVVVGFVLFSLLDSVLFSQDPFYVCGGKSLTWFVYLYMVAAYIRLYVTQTPKKIYLAIFATLSSVVTAAAYYGYMFLIEKSGASFIDPMNIRALCSAPVFLSSISLFLIFKDINIKGKCISSALVYLSPLTFGVYLIHDNPNIKNLLWGWICPEKYAEEAILWLYMLAIVPTIYIVCVALEVIRQKLFIVTRLNKAGEFTENKLITLSKKFFG